MKGDPQSGAKAQNAKGIAESQQPPEKLSYSTYYEHDGALRAYANRAMLLAAICAPTALIAVAIILFLLLRPMPVVRIDAHGVATMIDGRTVHASAVVAQGSATVPDELQKRAVVRAFLERYQNFTADTVGRQWADAVNMMSSNLRRATLSQMQTENAVGKVKDEGVTSIFHLGSIETDKDNPFTFTAFGVKEIHRVHSHQVSSEKLVLQYRIQLVPEDRSEQNPSGLLVASYSEQLIEGEKRDAILAASTPGAVN